MSDTVLDSVAPPGEPEESVVERLLAALAAHRAGESAAAEAGYRAVLRGRPEEPTALRLLGRLLLQVGRTVEAMSVLRAAVTAAPNNIESAIALADACAAGGRGEEAITLYRALLAAAPGQHGARVNLANALRDAGDAAGGVTECRIALNTAPRLVAAHVTLGSCLLAAGRVVEAIGAYRTAVGLDGGTATARTGYAMALLRDRRVVDALEAALRACEADDGLAEAWFVRGVAERTLSRFDDARTSLRRAVALDPGHARARLALGNTLDDLDDLEAAEAMLRTAIATEPALAEAHASLGHVLTRLGLPTAAATACDAAIALQPEMARAHWNRAVARLLGGDYTGGFNDYDWRRRDPRFAADFPAMSAVEWDGSPLAGKRLLVMAEQGLGDTIQFARFLPGLAAQGGRVTLACAPTLVRLLRGLPGLAGVVSREGPLPPHDCFVYLLSLPRLCGVTLDAIPAAAGYLATDPAAVARVTSGERRVGLAWAGNPAHSNDQRRSLPTAALIGLKDIAGIDWVNLQQGAAGAELAIMHRMAAPVRVSDFADTAALIAGLDLVIAADTAVAHLAGALGRPVWIMLPHAPDWRWLLGRGDSPWYASARLFRQERPGDWAGVIGRIAAELAADRSG